MKVSSVWCTNLIGLNQGMQLSVLFTFRAGNILLEGFSSLEKDCSFLFGIAPFISHTLVFYLLHPIFRSLFGCMQRNRCFLVQKHCFKPFIVGQIFHNCLRSGPRGGLTHPYGQPDGKISVCFTPALNQQKNLFLTDSRYLPLTGLRMFR